LGGGARLGVEIIDFSTCLGVADGGFIAPACSGSYLSSSPMISRPCSLDHLVGVVLLELELEWAGWEYSEREGMEGSD
jgi:hypothetical protein